MKKLFIIAGVILLMLLVVVVFWKDSFVSKKDVKSIVMKHAHLTSKDIYDWDIDLDYENDHWEYEVEFICDNVTHEYRIDARSGKILHHRIDHEDEGDKVMDRNESISLAQAQTLVINNVGLSKDAVTFTKAKTSYDDGRMIYELEFVTSEYQYVFEVDAVLGSILKKEVYPVHSTITEGTSYIGIDEAKKIALQHANMVEQDVVFHKEKLEHEHGAYVYEIEFYKDYREYEYEIDAVRGTIIDYSIGR